MKAFLGMRLRDSAIYPHSARVSTCIIRSNEDVGKNPPKSCYGDPARLFEISHREEGSSWRVFETISEPDKTYLPNELRRRSRFPIPTSIINVNQE